MNVERKVIERWLKARFRRGRMPGCVDVGKHIKWRCYTNGEADKRKRGRNTGKER